MDEIWITTKTNNYYEKQYKQEVVEGYVRLYVKGYYRDIESIKLFKICTTVYTGNDLKQTLIKIRSRRLKSNSEGQSGVVEIRNKRVV